MPTQEVPGDGQGFRSSLFGFDKNDVLAYINALAEDARQQREQAHAQLQAQQAQLEKLQSEQAAARLCVEKLQSELQQARQLTEAAELRSRQAEEKLAAAEKDAAEQEQRSKANQQAAVELRFRCHELEQKLAAAQEAPAPTPPAPPADSSPEEARIQARAILADAHLTAENAERELQRQAEEQKGRMADHARSIAAGVLLLRSRLARVDEKIGAATLDMENATAAIYQALDEVDTDLDALGARLEGFDPDDPVPAGLPQAGPAAQQIFDAPAATRPRVTAQPVAPRRARSARQARSAGRLRRSARTVSQELQNALDDFRDE